jgi:hypothetical protein
MAQEPWNLGSSPPRTAPAVKAMAIARIRMGILKRRLDRVVERELANAPPDPDQIAGEENP